MIQLMDIIILAIIAIILVLSFPAIKRYFSNDIIYNLVRLIFWAVNSLLALYIAAIGRQLYLVENTESFFQQGGSFDNSYIWLSLGVVILFAYLLFSFYSEDLQERLILVSSLQVALLTFLTIFNYMLEGRNIEGFTYLNYLFFFLGLSLFVIFLKKSKYNGLWDLFNEFTRRIF